MNTNANVNCSSFSTGQVQKEQEGAVAVPEGSEGCAEFVGQWDEQRQMMYYQVPVPALMPVEISGTVYYQPVSGCSSGYEMFDGSYSTQEEYFGDDHWTQEQNIEICQETTYPVVTQELMGPAPIEVSGTTYYCEWIDEMEQPLATNDDLAPLLQVLESLILEEHHLKEAGYPAIDGQGKVQIQPSSWDRGTTMWIDENEPLRKCSRCRVAFAVGADGRFPTGPGICQSKSKGQWNSEDGHITMQRFASELEKFAESPEPNAQHDARSDKIFALDVEMVSTTAGPALARLSVVDFDGRLVLDVFVKPEAPVVDYLTEFSGITKEMLGTAAHTLESCRDLFFELVNSKSILIGHGLDGDLKALRVIHQKVIDTSILYQDEGKKVALRVLAKQYLGRTIQADNSSTFGHSSEEDALASLDLVKHRIGFC